MRMLILPLVLLTTAGVAIAPEGSPQEVELPETVPTELGVASWYSEDDPGIQTHTASGKRFDSSKLWVATWRYPFGTKLLVVNRKTGQRVVVIVEDRGPAKRLGRAVDLTKTAFSHIADLEQGLVDVAIWEMN